MNNTTAYSGSNVYDKNEYKYYYKGLNPDKNADNSEEYLSAMDWAIKRSDIYNIAVSGPFGSGKSSVIQKYFSTHNEIKHHTISLSTFDDTPAFNEKVTTLNAKEESSPEKKNSSDKISPQEMPQDAITEMLEHKILKQLLYSVSSDTIPLSRFKKLQKPNQKQERKRGLFLAAVFFIVYLLFFIEKAKTAFIFLKTIPICYSIILLLGVCVLVYFICLKLVSWWPKNFIVKEIKVLDKATIANNQTNDESVFNKNLDEILYFFETTKCEVVVFEDIDRFNNIRIFNSLRELNSLLNNYERIDFKISFIYAIKDDLFNTGLDRTKFFDFIIPIIPFVSSTNSEDILRQQLLIDPISNVSKVFDINGDFLALISPFLNDMREIINICNEFNVFKNTLKERSQLKIDDSKLFSIIMYKTLYPRDFALLEEEKNESLLAIAFNNKQRFIEERIEEINETKEEEKKRLDQLEKEALHSVKELKYAFLGELTEGEGFVHTLTGEKTYELKEILSDEFDFECLKGRSINAREYTVPGNYQRSKTINSIEKADERTGGHYLDRMTQLKKGMEICKEDSRRKIEKLERSVLELRERSLQYIIEQNGSSFLDEAVQNNKFLVFLLRNGYIDEHYEYYINYFYPNSVTQEEMNFIFDMRTFSSELNYTVPLPHVSKVVSMLQLREYKQPGILNFSLVDYIVTQKRNTVEFKRLMEKIADRTPESMDFIKAFIERGRNRNELVRGICAESKYFWHDVLMDPGISNISRMTYLDLMLESCDIDHIVEQDQVLEGHSEGCLREMLLSEPDIFSFISSVSSEKQVEIIRGLNLKFYNTYLTPANDRVKNEILDNRCYELNSVMIREIVNWKVPNLVDSLQYQNYSAIMMSHIEALIDYVHDDFENYINKVVLEEESNTRETVDAVSDILSRLVRDKVGLCIEVLEKQGVAWEHIEDCCNGIDDADETVKEIWDYLLTHSRIACSWDNFSQYYLRYGMTEEAGSFFEMNSELLLRDIDLEEIDERFKKDILYAIKSDVVFKQYVRLVSFESYDDIDFSKLESGKQVVLTNTMPFTKMLFQKLQRISAKLCTILAIKNKKEFFEEIDSLGLTVATINSMLKENGFDDTEKKHILSYLGIRQLNLESAKAISSLKFTINNDLFVTSWRLLQGEQERFTLFLNQMQALSNEDKSRYLFDLDDEYKMLSDRSQSECKIPFSWYNYELAKKLKETGYLSAVEDKPKTKDRDSRTIICYFSK